MSYTKLSDLIDQQFTVKEVMGFGFKKWDETQKTMLFSKDFLLGYRKVWGVETDKGKLDLGSGQMGNLLEAVCFNGESKLIGKTFQVKSNGKSGQEVRYFLNYVKPESVKPEIIPDAEPSESNDDLPF